MGTHVRTHKRSRACHNTHARLHTQWRTRVQKVYTYNCTLACTYSHTWPQPTYTIDYTYSHTYNYAHINIQTGTHMHVYMHTPTWASTKVKDYHGYTCTHLATCAHVFRITHVRIKRIVGNARMLTIYSHTHDRTIAFPPHLFSIDTQESAHKQIPMAAYMHTPPRICDILCIQN